MKSQADDPFGTLESAHDFVALLAAAGSVTAVCLSDRRDELLTFGTVNLFLMGWFLGATGWYFLIPGATLSSSSSISRTSRGHHRLSPQRRGRAGLVMPPHCNNNEGRPSPRISFITGSSRDR